MNAQPPFEFSTSTAAGISTYQPLLQTLTDKEVHEDGADQREGEHALHVRLEVGPLPEVPHVEI